MFDISINETYHTNMKQVIAIKLCLMVVLLSFLFSGCIRSNVSESEDEKALRVIEKDVDDFRADLRALERGRGKPLDREVFIALDDAKQAVKSKNYGAILDCYRDALVLVRNHLADESVVDQYQQSMKEITELPLLGLTRVQRMIPLHLRHQQMIIVQQQQL